MTYDRSERIRRAAILVASLDEPIADAMLRDLPASESARILAELDRMDAIDPEEQADVLAEFRRATRSSASNPSAVEFALSAAAESRTTAPTVPAAASDAAADDADVAAIAELLSAEQPQIIAAALARLAPERASAVFASLPADLQADALERLSQLAPPDEQAVVEIETLLEREVAARRERRARTAAGVELAQRILARTTPDRRAVLMARLPGIGAEVDARAPLPLRAMGSWPTEAGPAQRWPAPSYRDAAPVDPAGVEWTASGVSEADADLTRELMALSDETLVAALRGAEEGVVQRALAASGETLVTRVACMLPRRQARTLRKLVHAFAAAPVAELREAQHALLRVAYEQERLAA